MCSHGLLKQIRIKKDATKSHNHEKSAHCDNARQIQTLQAPVENIYGYCRQPMFSESQTKCCIAALTSLHEYILAPW